MHRATASDSSLDGCQTSFEMWLRLMLASMVLETRLGDAGGGREFDLWLLKIGAEIVPVGDAFCSTIRTTAT